MEENARNIAVVRPDAPGVMRAFLTARDAVARDTRDMSIEIPPDSLRSPEDWASFFPTKGPFHVEIGAGRDTLLVDLGRQFPDRRILGVEYSHERVARLSRKICGADVGNVRLLCAEAGRCVACFLPAGSVESFYVFFPDPWPKKRHEDKRIVSGPAVRLFASRLAPGGRIFLKTDDPCYSRQMLEVLEKAPFLRNAHGPGSFAPFEGPLLHETLYEHKWRAQGRSIFSLVYVRADAP